MRSRATSDPDSAESAPLGDGTPSLWRPLRTPIFRNLLFADVMSDIGTFMQTVGAAWLMVSLGAGPMYVALTQTASALPFFVFALPAGAIGDIVDRRRLCRGGVRPQRGVVRWRDCAGGSVEAAGSPSHDAARDPGRCDGRRAQIRPLFTIDPRP